MVNQIRYIIQGILLTILFLLAFTFLKAIGSTVISNEPANGQFFCGTSSTVPNLSLIGTKGQELFASNCASCHALHKRLTGPALAGVELRWKSRKELYRWIHNPATYMKKDAYIKALYKESGGVMMTAFPHLTTEDMDAILDYTSAPVLSY